MKQIKYFTILFLIGISFANCSSSNIVKLGDYIKEMEQNTDNKNLTYLELDISSKDRIDESIEYFQELDLLIWGQYNNNYFFTIKGIPIGKKIRFPLDANSKNIQLRGKYLRPFRYGEFIESDPFPVAFTNGKEYGIKIHIMESKFNWTSLMLLPFDWPIIPFFWAAGGYPSFYRNVIYIQDLPDRKDKEVKEDNASSKDSLDLKK